MRKVAVTGGLSSGKSTVCSLLSEMGAFCVSADEIVHQLLSPATDVGQKIIQLLGQEIVCKNQLIKEKIAEIVFEKKEYLKAIEHILHPAILEEIEKRYNQAKTSKDYTLFVAEIPLLYEIEKAHLFDAVIAVVSDPGLAKQRFQGKTGSDNREFERRMIHQLPQEEKSAKADYTIQNNGDLTSLKNQVQTLHQTLTNIGTP